VTAYSLAPCWDDELPYYGLFVERGDFANTQQAVKLAEALDRRLGEVNIEYAAKRGSQRLGPVRLELLSKGAWLRWERRRLARSGGTAEQYKHPCLIGDPKFRESIPVEQEVTPSDVAAPQHQTFRPEESEQAPGSSPVKGGGQ
jgi:hypothetical protein